MGTVLFIVKKSAVESYLLFVEVYEEHVSSERVSTLYK